MSMNIYITAEREITFNGEPDTQVVAFDAIQTPTKITNEILESGNPSQTYIDWVLNEVSYKEHVKEFKEWIEEHKNKGYTIRFSEC